MKAPDVITLRLQWLPQSQFAGYYAAHDEGIYRRHGLNVRLLHSGPGQSPMREAATGASTFATSFLTAAIEARDQGLPVVNVCQVINRCNLMLTAWSREVKRLEQLHQKKVSIWSGDFRAPYVSVFRSHRIDPRIYTQNYSMELFIRKGVSACSCMYYNEYHTLYLSGVDWDEMTALLLRELGCDMPEDGIYTSAEFARQHPDICRAFAEATLEGWKWASQHTEETLDRVMQRVKQAWVPSNRVHMRWMLQEMIASVFPDSQSARQTGKLLQDDYTRTVALLRNQRIIRNSVPLDQFTTPEARP